MPTSVDWTTSYTYDDVTVAGAQAPATARPPLQQNADGSYAYDISGNVQSWEPPASEALYL